MSKNADTISFLSYDGSTASTDSESVLLDVESACSCLPCCMTPEAAEDFGHHVSIFMVALLAFATFFCVNLILVLVFVLG
uniref:G-protein coupled receptors family 1 profile domain-containing protein n=1 Tax=Panagrellus redivivus TaxID=6233 RepID=A0A7E4ZXW0_PANRE